MNETTTSARAGGNPAKGFVAAGGLIGALAASSCCVLPLALFSLGASGAWIGNLTALAPYQPIFVAITLGFLATGYWMVYRRPRATSIVKFALWGATVLVAAAMAFPYVAPLLLDI